MFKTIKEFIEAKDARRHALERELDRLVTKLCAMGAKRIVLFGSLANKRITPWSDVDILVIIRNDQSSREWRKMIYEDSERSVAMDILVFTEEEYLENIEHSSLLQEIAHNGVLIYEQA